MQNALLAVLVLVVALLLMRAFSRERRDYDRFKRMSATADRQRTYRRWLLEGFCTLGGLTVVVLLAAGRYVGPLLDDVHGSGWLGAVLPRPGIGLALGILLGLAAAAVALVVVTAVVGRSAEQLPSLGDVTALIPRNRAELGYGIGLSLNAGLVEEALFRVALPALLFGVVHSALLAFVLSALLFGLLHVYQGVWGVVGAAVLGLALTAVYLATGTIVAAMALHAVIDMRSLALIPVVVWRVHRIPGDVSGAPAFAAAGRHAHDERAGGPDDGPDDGGARIEPLSGPEANAEAGAEADPSRSTGGRHRGE